MKISETALQVLKKRYLQENETPEMMFRRVANAVGNGDPVQSDIYYNMMTSFDFLPNSPTLMNAGKQDGQLSACFVLPIEDSMDSIFTTIKNTALIHKTGGGTGFSFSNLRMAGSRVKSTNGVSSGPVSFMRVFDAATEAVKQGGTRRGANMGLLRVDHPDIIDFIHCKDNDGDIKNFNISVALTDEFMRALLNKADFKLRDPHDNSFEKMISAEKLFSEIVKCAWKTGEPGIIFIDRINEKWMDQAKSMGVDAGVIEAVNPCGEQPLLPYEACNLGSINLSNHVINGHIDYVKLEKTVFHAICFLDNVIDVNCYPLPEIQEMVTKYRKIGLGVMGLADAFIKCGLQYDSHDALLFAGRCMQFIKEKAMKIQRPEIYNATITTIAPTGTLSMIADCSSGIEPIYSFAYTKNVLDSNFMYIHPELEKILSSDDLDKLKSGDMSVIPTNSVFRSAHDISPEWHVRMQAAVQEHVDNAVSKTINMPNSATDKDVKDAILLAYNLGCKGVTVYRDGSRSGQVLTTIASTGFSVDAPRKRPIVTRGETHKTKTGCGNFYVTVNKDEHGFCEIFTMIGKAGGCSASNAEAVARLCSIALQSGVPMSVLRDQLCGIRCSNPIWCNGKQVLSCSDALASVMSNVLSEKSSVIERTPCPECGASMIADSGCWRCSCGYSKCG